MLCERSIIVSIIIFLGSSGAVVQASQSSGAPGIYLRIPIGARALAMGGAFSSVCDDATTIFWNATGATQFGRMQIVAGYYPMPYDRRLTYTAASYPIKRYSNLSVGWVGFGINNIEARIMNTQHSDYIFSNTENAIMLSYSHRVVSKLLIGATVKVLNHTLGANTATGHGFDLGFLLRPTKTWNAALSIQDVETQLNWQNGYHETFPSRLRLGTSIQVDHHVRIAADISKTAQETTQLHIGAEIGMLDMLLIRTGYNADRLTAGFGLTIPLYPLRVQLDYVYTSEEINIGAIHGISMSISFKSKRSNQLASRLQNPSTNAQIHIQMLEVTAQKLNVRTGPGNTYNIVTQVKKGQWLQKISTKGMWINIRLNDDVVGWVHMNYIREVE